ncbi:MAG: PilZ domain-containing protein [Sedimentisphaerales bacterium]
MEALEGASDRRKHKRLPVKVGAFCRKVGSLSDRTLKGNTVDICPDGLLVEACPVLAEGSGQDFATDTGDLFTIELDVPDADTANRFGGKVSAYARVIRIVDSLPQQKTAKKHIAFQFCSRPQFEI